MQIKKLFGMFDHDIPFNISDRITIIHGPNGLGKTTILRMISELFSMHFGYFQSLPFDAMVLTFEDNATLRVTKRFSRSRGPRVHPAFMEEKKRRQVEVDFSLKRGRRTQHWTSRPSEEFYPHRYPLHVIERAIPWLERVGAMRWLDRRSGDVLSFEDVLSRFPRYLPFEVAAIASKSAPKWLQNLLGGLSTYFIETQRLFSYTAEEGSEHRRDKRSVTAEQYSSDMAKRIQEKLRESGSLSASLDRTFPHRLLQEQVPKSIDDRRIRDKYRTQSEYRDRLMKAGLIEPEKPVTLPRSSLEKADIRVLWHYMSDVAKRLEVFHELLEKVELFKDIINTRFLYKCFALDKTNGFVFTNDKGVVLPPTALSSGEQHELVLAYQLIFMVQPKALILIDEPELSLHVTWQHMFLDDLMRISKLVDLDFIIATHSPSIVHQRTDLMVPLEGPAR
jgi:predicted ATP-binding protein involved in virulence